LSFIAGLPGKSADLSVENANFLCALLDLQQEKSIKFHIPHLIVMTEFEGTPELGQTGKL
jgi:hypothetical protein